MMKNELAFKDRNAAFRVADMLIDEDYVVMISKEEDLIIVNYEWSEHNSDRNDVVFMRRDEFEEQYFEAANVDENDDDW
jgi:phosphopantothenoylcysteine synthetase/decarboxylase